MREFLIQCLKDLKSVSGIPQYEFLKVLPPTEFKRETDLLLDSMVKTCERFTRMTEQRKQTIIREMMVEDMEFENLNSRTLFKWLTAKNPIASETYTEAPRVELTPEEVKRIDEIAESFKSNLKGVGASIEVSEAELEKLKQEDANRIKPKSYSVGYKPPSAEELELRDLKMEWIRECTDPMTAKIISGKPEFKEWLKTRQK